MLLSSKIQLKKYLKIRIQDLVLIQFIIEGYEGLANITTLDRKEGIIRIMCPSEAMDDVNHLLENLRANYRLERIDYCE